MIINVELLKYLGVCEDGIERFIKHFNGTLEIPDDITEYATHDDLFNDLIWLVNNLHISIKHINKYTEIWFRSKYISSGNETYTESSEGNWKYLSTTQIIPKPYSENSNGVIK
jgi:hypothetical protein